MLDTVTEALKHVRFIGRSLVRRVDELRLLQIENEVFQAVELNMENWFLLVQNLSMKFFVSVTKFMDQ